MTLRLSKNLGFHLSRQRFEVMTPIFGFGLAYKAPLACQASKIESGIWVAWVWNQRKREPGTAIRSRKWMRESNG